jgi:hypothetical protein
MLIKIIFFALAKELKERLEPIGLSAGSGAIVGDL